MRTPPAPRLTSLLLAAATAALFLVGAASPCQAQTDDFNDGNDTGWTRYNVFAAFVPSFAQWTFPNGAYRIRTTMASPDPSLLGPGRAGSYRTTPEYTDFYVSVDVLDWDDSLNQAFGILARVTNPGLGTTDGYGFTYQKGDSAVSISRILGETPADVSGSARTITLDPAKQYRFVFLGTGSNLEGRVYELPNTTTPIVVSTGVDETHTGGISGLVVFDNSSADDGLTDATFDNYFAAAQEPVTSTPPTLTYSRPSATQLAVSWPSTATGFVLQRTSALTSTPTWTDITTGIVPNAGTNTYTETIGATPAWFRMKK